MFIEQALKYKHDWWRYLIGFITVLIAWNVIGGIPLYIVLALKILETGSAPTEVVDIINMVGNNTFLILSIFGFAVGLAALFVWVKTVHKQPLLELTTTRPKIDWKRVGVGFLVVGVLNTAQLGVDYYLSPGDYVFNFHWEAFLVLVAIVAFLPLQTSLEEYLFRGYLMQGLGIGSSTKWLPLLLTSTMFGLMHLGNPEVDKLGYVVMVYYIGTGLTLGIMTLMDDGMELALGYHAGNNVLSALLVTADWSAIQTDSVFKDISTPVLGLDVFFPLIIQAFILLLFAKIYKWKTWKAKLFGKLQILN